VATHVCSHSGLSFWEAAAHRRPSPTSSAHCTDLRDLWSRTSACVPPEEELTPRCPSLLCERCRARAKELGLRAVAHASGSVARPGRNGSRGLPRSASLPCRSHPNSTSTEPKEATELPVAVGVPRPPDAPQRISSRVVLPFSTRGPSIHETAPVDLLVSEAELRHGQGARHICQLSYCEITAYRGSAWPELRTTCAAASGERRSLDHVASSRKKRTEWW
jgi:hypothetical protein